MPDDDKTWFEIVKHKFVVVAGQQLAPDTVVGKVQSRARAEQAVQAAERKLTDEEKQQGWACHYQETTKPSGDRPKPKPKTVRRSRR